MKNGILGFVLGVSLCAAVMISLNPQRDAHHAVKRTPSSTSSNKSSGFTCRLSTPDFGDIVGHGDTKDDAFADAAEKCYKKREAQFENLRHRMIGMDQGEDMILSCVNLSCRG